MTEEKLGKPRGHFGKENDNQQTDQLEDDEGHDAPVNMAHGVTLGSHSRKIEQRISEWWRQEGRLKVNAHENRKPQGIEAEFQGDGHENRNRHHEEWPPNR